MGKSSTAVNHWMRDRGRFADLFNGVVFDGEQVVCPEDLEEARGESDILVPDQDKKERQVQRYRDIVMHDPEKFTSDLQLIFGMLKYRGDMRELQKYMDRHREYFQNVDADTYRAAREMLHAGGVMESMREEKDRKEGTVNMCKALEDLYQSGVDSGMEMGIQALVETCRELGQTREVTEKKVGEKFTVSREKVRECMEKYWA